MTHELFLGLIAFAFATSASPGPNSIMLMASGVNFGFRATVPHMLGVALGFGMMVLLVGLGLSGLFHAEPRAGLVLKIVSIVYMLWLAWKIARASAPKEGKIRGRPFSFLQAAAFQWVNPKAWAMALTATSVYAPSESWHDMAFIAVVFLAINFPLVALWAAVGQGLRGLLSNPRWLRIFNVTMALLLVASLWPVLEV